MTITLTFQWKEIPLIHFFWRVTINECLWSEILLANDFVFLFETFNTREDYIEECNRIQSAIIIIFLRWLEESESEYDMSKSPIYDFAVEIIIFFTRITSRKSDGTHFLFLTFCLPSYLWCYPWAINSSSNEHIPEAWASLPYSWILAYLTFLLPLLLSQDMSNLPMRPNYWRTSHCFLSVEYANLRTTSVTHS